MIKEGIIKIGIKINAIGNTRNKENKQSQRWFFEKFNEDFPGGPVVKTLPSNAGGAGLIPGWGAKIPHTSRPKNQKIKQKQYCNKFNKDFKIDPHQKRKTT